VIRALSPTQARHQLALVDTGRTATAAELSEDCDCHVAQQEDLVALVWA